MKNCLFSLLLLTSIFLHGQIQPVDVAEITLKVKSGGTEELIYGFAEGDQIIFNFEETAGKELKEVEIIELPNNSKFKDFKSIKIENKVINVYKKSLFSFKFYNSSLSARICKVKIQRIPKSEDLINFNTNWTWKTIYDTSYVAYKQDSLIGYDTVRYTEYIKELSQTIQTEELIFDKTQTIHSKWNSTENKTWLFFTLPSNQSSPYETKKVIAWAYWVGVGTVASDAWKQNVKIAGNIVKGAAQLFTTPLGAFAIGAVTNLVTPQTGTGEDVYYSITNEIGKEGFIAGVDYKAFGNGVGIAGYQKFTAEALCQGTYFVCLLNDNKVTPIDVNVKVVAIIEIKKYEDRPYPRMKINPRKITLTKQRMVINKTQVRINED